MVHPTFRVILESCSANNLSLKYRSSLNPYAVLFKIFHSHNFFNRFLIPNSRKIIIPNSR